MNKLLNMLKGTKVDMQMCVDELGFVTVRFSKDNYQVKKILDPNEYLFSELTIEDYIIYVLNYFLDFLGESETNVEQCEFLHKKFNVIPDQISTISLKR